jgi:hypothetical protein
MKLHQMGEDLVRTVREHLERPEHLSEREVRDLLREIEIVLRGLLARDVIRAPGPE